MKNPCERALNKLGPSGYVRPKLEKRPTVTVEVTLVKHGYQITVKDFSYSTSNNNGVIVYKEVNDFAGNYDTALSAEVISKAFLKAMQNVEQEIKKVHNRK